MSHKFQNVQIDIVKSILRGQSMCELSSFRFEIFSGFRIHPTQGINYDYEWAINNFR